MVPVHSLQYVADAVETPFKKKIKSRLGTDQSSEVLFTENDRTFQDDLNSDFVQQDYTQSKSRYPIKN